MSDKPEQTDSEKKSSKRDYIRFLGMASLVGINLVASTFIGFAIGYYILDGYIFPKLLSLNTKPWFTIIFLLVGIAAGFRHLFRIAAKLSDDKDSQE